MDINQAKQKAARYCAYQERRRKEVEKKLLEWGLTGNKCQKALDDLESAGFFSDERYALLYARGKFYNNKWGRIKIRVNLKQQDISDDLIALALDEIPEEEYEELATRFVREKFESIDHENIFSRKNKTARFLIQKGFEPDLVWRKIEEYCS